jgi:imidazolonepropionase-like amidohydrolase
VRRFVSVEAPVVALLHVTVVDGTGAPPQRDRTVLLEGNRIAAVGPADEVRIPSGARELDLQGHTVIPGIVGMHDHTDYTGVRTRVALIHTAPRMYLGSGVTTIRTAGSLSPFAEVNLRRDVDAGRVPGPRIHISGPRLSVGGSHFTPETPEDVRRYVAFWEAEGARWLKAHSQVRRADLAAAVEEAHRRGMKMTGHLCSVTAREAAELGIDNLEHGLYVMSDFVPDKEPDVCPQGQSRSLVDLDIQGPEAQDLIRTLVDRGVAITSTLAVIEQLVPGRPVEDRTLDVMSPDVRAAFLERRRSLEAMADRSPMPAIFPKVLEFERAFVDAGGLLAAGVDPTGNGGALPGFGDQRNFELLIEAGFSPLEALRIMTLNGAILLGDGDQLGSVEPGKLADLVVIDGDPIENPAEIRNVTLVFKDGVGYDAPELINSVRGEVGAR